MRLLVGIRSASSNGVLRIEWHIKRIERIGFRPDLLTIIVAVIIRVRFKWSGVVSGFGTIARIISIRVFTSIGDAVTIRVTIKWIGECFGLLIYVADAIVVKITGLVPGRRTKRVAVASTRIGWRAILRLFRRGWLLIGRVGVIRRIQRVTINKPTLGKSLRLGDARKLLAITFAAEVRIQQLRMSLRTLLLEVRQSVVVRVIPGIVEGDVQAMRGLPKIMHAVLIIIHPHILSAQVSGKKACGDERWETCPGPDVLEATKHAFNDDDGGGGFS